MKKSIRAASAIAALLLVQGCATNLSKPSGPPQPASVRFGTFDQVELEPVAIAPSFAEAGANKKAARKINELLQQQMAYVFPGLNNAATQEGSVLLIRPVIKEIKFIGGAARFWVGAMAGSSAVLMEVVYLDKDTGAMIAKAEFYDQASAYAGAHNMGASDNLMLNNVVTQIINYTSANR